MLWFMVLQIVSTLVELIQLRRTSASDKELEILLLRRQLAIYERKQRQPMRLTRGEKLTLVVLAVRLKATTGRTIKQLGDVIRIVKPKTVFGWHRELVRWKWTYRQRNRGGRPRTDRDIERLVMRLARENGWGNERIEGELLKLGYEISDETVANILRRHGIPPVPERDTSPSWRHLMTHYKDQLLACDFFTIDTLFLQTLYVLIFIEIGSRRVHFAGCTAHPDNAWITQQARQVMWELDEREPSHPLSDPRQRQEVQPRLRHGVPVGRYPCDSHPSSCPECERVCGKVDPLRPGRMPGQGVDHQSGAFAPCHARVRRLFQYGAPTSRD